MSYFELATTEVHPEWRQISGTEGVVVRALMRVRRTGSHAER